MMMLMIIMILMSVMMITSDEEYDDESSLVRDLYPKVVQASFRKLTCSWSLMICMIFMMMMATMIDRC